MVPCKYTFEVNEILTKKISSVVLHNIDISLENDADDDQLSLRIQFQQWLVK